MDGEGGENNLIMRILTKDIKIVSQELKNMDHKDYPL